MRYDAYEFLISLTIALCPGSLFEWDSQIGFYLAVLSIGTFLTGFTPLHQREGSMLSWGTDKGISGIVSQPQEVNAIHSIVRLRVAPNDANSRWKRAEWHGSIRG